MNKRFYALTIQVRRTSLPCNIRVDIGSPSDFLHWWRRNGFVEAQYREVYPFTWTYAHDRSTEHPGNITVLRQDVPRCAFVYVDFCLLGVKDIIYNLSDFACVFFGGASNPSRPHFGMCVTIDVK